jgi:hypothetical protein
MSVESLPDGRMDTRNAAAYLGLAVQTLARKRCDGTGPRFVKRGRIFYYRADLDAWLQGGQARSTAEAKQAANGGHRPVSIASGRDSGSGG